MQTEYNDITPESAIARGKRIQTLRKMASLSRDEFHKRYGIPKGTLQNWESARFSGLTIKGANNIVTAFNAEGIICSIDWILYGIGQNPQFTDHSSNLRNKKLYEFSKVKRHVFESETNNITKEILLFRENNPNSIDMVVPDDSMEPFWIAGDYIAGIKLFQDDISTTIDKYCIVQTTQYGSILRKVIRGDGNDTYNLHSMNYNSSIKRPVLYNVEIISSAPVMWTRRIDTRQ